MKIKKLFVVVFVLMLFAAALTACGKEFTVTFDGNGSVLAEGEEVQTAKKGKGVTAPVYTKEGYTLSWDGSFDNITSDITVTAVWTPIKYTYTFNNWDGTELITQTADYGSAISAPANPSKAATAELTFAFTGWSPAVPETLTANITFTAQYSQAARQYSYTFLNWDGTVLITQTASYGSAINPPNASRAETAAYTYAFAGWSPAVPDTLTANMVFAAQFTQTLRQYTYTFLDWDGTKLGSQTADYGSLINASDILPTRASTAASTFDFTGWSPALPHILIENTVFTAEYTQAVRLYTATFQSNGGSTVAPISVPYNTAIIAPLSPVKNGYTFRGWFADIDCTQAYNFATLTVEDIELYAKWEEGTEGLVYSFIKEGTEYCVTGYNGTDGEVYIPSDYNGKPVTSIGQEAFCDAWRIESVVMPLGLTSIGIGAFYYCKKLESIELPESLTGIDERAFYDCSLLKSITITATTPPVLGYNTLEGTSSSLLIFVPSASLAAYMTADRWSEYAASIVPFTVTAIYNNKKVVSVANAAFNNKNVTSVTISSNVKNIGNDTFSGCIYLNKIIIPDSVTEIGSNAFNSCTGLTLSFIKRC